MPPFAGDNMMLTSSLRSSHSDMRAKVQCVCFDAEPHVQFIEPVDELPDDILEACWYGEDEMKGMMQEASGVLDGSNKIDLPRGLEHCTYEGMQRRRAERSKASEAVLGEQLRQHAFKALDNAVVHNADELIAMEYRKVSQKQQELAYQRARSDAAEASDRFFHKPLSAVKNWFRSSDRSQQSLSQQSLLSTSA
ncbi:expressed unknown protein [Seminavis robusta]|uniref:Uncharacterized protein n=1 Tax=Seminavis robusta TaxID=568900 RepID=A0A9N8D5Q4_9STRA|nr:expressed unknown protein [Seminavis robusta]|eukprot:Sro12_g009120.1 n/a (194) ;mRNA; f:21388-21969